MQPRASSADYDASFGKRMRGEGVFAELIARRFAIAHRKLGFVAGRERVLDTAQFIPPRADRAQGELF